MDEDERWGRQPDLTREDVRAPYCRQAAQQLLKRQGLKAPPVPVIDIAERLGFSVLRVRLPRGLDARLVVTQQGASIELALGQARVRHRFSVAHELGHHCLGHSHRDGELTEKQANIFAGALLVPRSWLATDVKRGLTPAELAARYDVSSEVVFIALKESRLLAKVR